MFWEVFKWSKMKPDLFFDLSDEQKVNSTIYRDYILIELLQEFWKELFEDIWEPIVMTDNTSIYKKVYIFVRQELEMKCYQYLSNLPDLNSIENI